MEPVVLLEKKGRIAYITLNRPHAFNAINETLPQELSKCVQQANQDSEIRVIILQGAGKAFCSGYDLKIYAEAKRPVPGSQNMPWDPTIDFALMNQNTQHFMSIWRSHKPVIAKIKGAAIAGGSDIALCCDIIFMAKDAKIGYPPARLWGVPTTMMWVYRLGLEKAKNMLLNGKVIRGDEAKAMDLITDCFDSNEELDKKVDEYANEMAKIPLNQLVMNKLVVNQAYENMGLHTTQLIATLFDGIARHTPEGCAFKSRAETVGFKRAVQERDSNPDVLLHAKL